MKLLSVHCDSISFKPLKKALKIPEELRDEQKNETTVDEALVIFTAVEKQDEGNKKLIERYVHEIVNIAGQVHAGNIVLYPYAHLSSSLSKPDFALRVFEDAEKELIEKKFKVWRAPFGYYKEFTLKCKGHPLSELSREIKNEETSKEQEETYDHTQLLKEINKSKLDTSKLKDNDHRILGQRMNLFSFSDVAPGMVFWHHNGLIIFNSLVNFWREEHIRVGYQEIKTPQILDKKIWQISGHWEKYKENIFLSEYEKRQFAVKPMNCPGAMLVYSHHTHSYKDLPLRLAELGIVHRQELSGVLLGLFRVIQFTQDDAHIFCTENQLEEEIFRIMELIDRFYTLFGFSYHVELSTRPEKRMGDEKIWDKAESILEKTMKKKKIKFKINKGDGAFYGPKIDFHIKDSLERIWQLATIQLDFSMPARFNLHYTDKDNTEKQPIIIHRVIYGSLERFIGILLEHTNGQLPLWLAPEQARVINFTYRNTKACEKLIKELQAKNVRVSTDFGSEPIQGKIKQAEIEKIPYIVVIGDKEEKSGKLAVRKKGNVTSMKKEKFIDAMVKEIEGKKLFV